MKLKIIFAIIFLAAGIGLYMSSDYITSKVAEGRGEIYRGQKTVNSINKVIDTTTQVKGLSGIVTGGAQNKIDAGTHKANYYDRLAKNLRLGGLGSVFLSALLFVWAFLTRKKSK